jgi:hypothetical protein
VWNHTVHYSSILTSHRLASTNHVYVAWWVSNLRFGFSQKSELHSELHLVALYSSYYHSINIFTTALKNRSNITPIGSSQTSKLLHSELHSVALFSSYFVFLSIYIFTTTLKICYNITLICCKSTLRSLGFLHFYYKQSDRRITETT